MIVAEAVGAALTRLGVRTVFGVVGSGNFHVTNALIGGGARFVAARHEAGAATMADAYARCTGDVGVLSVHQGPGLTNALTGITEAAKSRTPLLVLAAETAGPAVRSNFRIDQAALATAVGAISERVHSPTSALADVTRAWRTAILERRTVVLGLPLDIQAAPYPDPLPPPEPPGAHTGSIMAPEPPAPTTLDTGTATTRGPAASAGAPITTPQPPTPHIRPVVPPAPTSLHSEPDAAPEPPAPATLDTGTATTRGPAASTGAPTTTPRPPASATRHIGPVLPPAPTIRHTGPPVAAEPPTPDTPDTGPTATAEPATPTTPDAGPVTTPEPPTPTISETGAVTALEPPTPAASRTEPITAPGPLTPTVHDTGPGAGPQPPAPGDLRAGAVVVAGQRIAAAPVPAPAVVAGLADALASARRPVFLAGRGARGAAGALRALAERTGALLATSAVVRGLFRGDPFDLDVSGGFATPVAAELVRDADLLVGWGCSMNMWTLRHGSLVGEDTTVVQVDLDSDALGAHRPIDLGVVGDVAGTAAAVEQELARRSHFSVGSRRPEVAERLAGEGRWRDVPYEDQSDGTTIDPRTLSIALDDLLPTPRTVAVDSGNFMAYPAMFLEVPDGGLVFTQAFQSVGLGLATAIGAAIARPDRLTVAGLGDGGALMGIAELETAVRLGLGLLVVVYDDEAYGAEVHHFGPDGHPLDTVRFPPADIAAIGRGFGCAAITVRRLEDLAPVSDWLNGPRDRPLVIDAKVTSGPSWWLEEAFRGH